MFDDPRVKVSPEDWEYCSRFKWYIDRHGYVRRCVRGLRGTDRESSLARVIMRARRGEVVHHKNGDRLDNRRENLQLLSSQKEHEKIHYIERVKRFIKKRDLRAFVEGERLKNLK